MYFGLINCINGIINTMRILMHCNVEISYTNTNYFMQSLKQ